MAVRESEKSEPGCTIDEAIWRAFLLLEALDRRALAALDPPLTAAQFHALMALARVPVQSLNELAARLLCAKANASGLVDRLSAMALVSRVRDPDDARRVVLRLTVDGQAALARAKLAHAEALRRAFDTLAPADLQAAGQALDQLCVNLETAVLTYARTG